MKKRSILALVFMLAIGLLLAACGSDEGVEGDGEGDGSNNDDQDTAQESDGDYRTNLTLGTGSTGGVYFPLGGEIATVLNNNIDVEGFDVSSVSSGASVENIAKIGNGEFQMGIAQNTTSFNAIDGKEDFEGRTVDNFGVIASLYPESLQVVTLESTGIESIDELKGKKVAVGPPGGATRRAAELVLKAYGIEEGDYDPFEEGFSDAKDKLQNGTIDAAIYVVGIPSSAANELQAATKEVKFLDLNDEAIQMFEEETQYEKYEMEAGTYDWQEEPVTTVTAMAILLGSTDQISEDLGYKITKNLFEHTDDMAIDQAKLIKKDAAFIGVHDLPLHPGAKKYYEEEGLLENYEGEQ